MQGSIAAVLREVNERARMLSEGLKTYAESDGTRRCCKCGDVVKSVKHFTSPAMLRAYPHGMEVWSICRCKASERQAIRAELKREATVNEIPRRQAECFKSPAMNAMTFDRDDSPTSEASQLSRRWVQNYSANAVRGSAKWLFFYGGYGTGKTYYAACIANAMICKGYDVRMATGADLEAEIFAADDKAMAYRKLLSYELLILDDFNAERKSDYMYEILYNIVNDRYNARKAMIITSNMTTTETVDPQDGRVRRIMSRVWEMGYPIEVAGFDRRQANSAWGAWR